MAERATSFSIRLEADMKDMRASFKSVRDELDRLSAGFRSFSDKALSLIHI